MKRLIFPIIFYLPLKSCKSPKPISGLAPFPNYISTSTLTISNTLVPLSNGIDFDKINSNEYPDKVYGQEIFFQVEAKEKSHLKEEQLFLIKTITLSQYFILVNDKWEMVV